MHSQDRRKYKVKIKKLVDMLLGRKPKSQDELRQEYETKMYDHYQAFGSAFVNFCSGR